MPRRGRSPLIVLADAGRGAGRSEDGAPVPPLYLRLYARIRGLILEERFPSGARLPSSRALAHDLRLSRTTVELAYDQLLAEGFVERRRGAGTFVAAVVPDRPLGLPAVDRPTGPAAAAEPGVSAQGRRWLETPPLRDEGQPPSGFAPCRPGAELFPIQLWNRTLVRTARQRGPELQQVAPAAGDPQLRAALAAHLAGSRSVRCTPEQIVVTSSTQQALDLLARLLLDPGDAVWIEEPGYLGARAALHAAGARLVPVPVDADGLDPEAGRRLAPAARLAYVTPSHQYPSGATLGLARRLELLHWAASANAWVIEDDYDSEFRYDGRPLAPLQSIDASGRVIYLGTFNKALFPGLRLAYAVLPPALVRAFARALEAAAGPLPTLPQAVLADFLAEGLFASHLRRLRERYRERRDALLQAADAIFAGAVRLGPAQTGLHVCAYLPEGTSDIAASARAAQAGLHVPPLSSCYLGPAPHEGLILGYGGLDGRAIRQGIETLARALNIG